MEAAIIEKIKIEKARFIPNHFSCAPSCGRNDNYDMNKLWKADEDVRSLKYLVMTGFSHSAVLSVADTVIEAVKAGAIKHFFLVGGLLRIMDMASAAMRTAPSR